MKTRKNKWILPATTVVSTFTIFLYCLYEYHYQLPTIIVAALLVVGSAFWLFSSINKQLALQASDSPTVGEQEKERLQFEGIKFQLEALNHSVNTLGKGTYINIKKVADTLASVSTTLDSIYKQSHNDLEQINTQQEKLVKAQLKYATDNTAKILDSLAHDLPDKLQNVLASNSPNIQMPEMSSITIPDTTPQLEAIERSISQLSLELSKLQLSVEHEESPVVEESALVVDEPAPVVTPVDDNPNRQLTPEEIATMFASIG